MKLTKFEKKNVSKKEKEKFKSKLKKEENEGKRDLENLPYIKGITDKIGRRLGKFRIRAAFKAKQKSGKMEQKGIYKINCK